MGAWRYALVLTLMWAPELSAQEAAPAPPTQAPAGPPGETPPAAEAAPPAPAATEELPAVDGAPAPAAADGSEAAADAPVADPAAAPAAAPEPAPAAPASAEAAPTTPAPPEFAEPAAAPAPAPLPPPPPRTTGEEGDWGPYEKGGEEHDSFMLRLALGVGFGSASSDALSYGGAGGAISVSGGIAVTENVIIHADFASTSMHDASIEVRGAEAVDSTIDVQLSAVTLGVTYYFMPVNFYVSASAGMGAVVFDAANGASQASNPGFAAQGLVGKEWWVGKQWGIGLAVQILLVMAEDDYDGPLTGLTGGAMFSATYN